MQYIKKNKNKNIIINKHIKENLKIFFINLKKIKNNYLIKYKKDINSKKIKIKLIKKNKKNESCI